MAGARVPEVRPGQVWHLRGWGVNVTIDRIEAAPEPGRQMVHFRPPLHRTQYGTVLDRMYLDGFEAGFLHPVAGREYVLVSEAP